MQHIRVVGKIETPIVSKKNYRLGDWKIAIASKRYIDDLFRPYESYSKPRFYGKNKSFLKDGNETSRPFNFICHMGFIHLDFVSDNPQNDILKICSIKQFGKFKNDGMGKVRWEQYKIFEDNRFEDIIIKNDRLKLKKLLLGDIDESMYPLLTAGLVHDLVLIPKKHPSKLGNISINIQDDDIKWLIDNHHQQNASNPQLKKLQQADRLASMICRKHMQPVNTQFGYAKQTLNKLEVLEIVNNIENRLNNFKELYKYIYSENRLNNFVESQKYGLSSLRKHLLFTVQLMLTQ